MKTLYSTDKNYVIKDDDSLYAVIRTYDDTRITIFNIESLSEVGSFAIKCKVSNKCHSIIDINHIYLVDYESNLLCIDKISGEILRRTPLGSLCIANLEQDEEFVYILCLLPIRLDKMKFTTYFIQKIDKTTGETFKFAYREGKPVQSIILQNQDIIISDTSTVVCFSKNGKEKREISLRSPMMNPLIGDKKKYIVASSEKGKTQLIDTLIKRSKFGLQLPKSRVLPLVIEETLYWLSESNLHAISIPKISARTFPWENKIALPIEHPIIMGIYNNEYIIGNLNGQMLINNAIFTLNKEEQTPIVDIDVCYNKVVCETSQKVYVLGDS